jgi:biopolymer transport protein ExbD
MPKVLPVPTGGVSRGRSRRVATTLAEINVIPLVDVMLVLLIIFMVTAPMLQRGVEVKLPQAAKAQEISSERLFVDVPLSFRTDQRVYIEKEPIRLPLLRERLRQRLQNRTDKDVFLRIEGTLTVQDMMKVGDELRAGGARNMGVITEPVQQR